MPHPRLRRASWLARIEGRLADAVVELEALKAEVAELATLACTPRPRRAVGAQGGVDGFSGEEEPDVERADERFDDEVGVDALGELAACNGPLE